MNATLDEITEDVIGSNLNSMGPDEELTVNVRDMREMLEEAYAAGRKSAFSEAE